MKRQKTLGNSFNVRYYVARSCHSKRSMSCFPVRERSFASSYILHSRSYRVDTFVYLLLSVTPDGSWWSSQWFIITLHAVITYHYLHPRKWKPTCRYKPCTLWQKRELCASQLWPNRYFGSSLLDGNWLEGSDVKSFSNSWLLFAYPSRK